MLFLIMFLVDYGEVSVGAEHLLCVDPGGSRRSRVLRQQRLNIDQVNQ